MATPRRNRRPTVNEVPNGYPKVPPKPVAVGRPVVVRNSGRPRSVVVGGPVVVNGVVYTRPVIDPNPNHALNPYSPFNKANKPPRRTRPERPPVVRPPVVVPDRPPKKRLRLSALALGLNSRPSSSRPDRNRSPNKVREPIDEKDKLVCKSRPKDNRKKGGGGSGKKFVPWC